MQFVVICVTDGDTFIAIIFAKKHIEMLRKIKTPGFVNPVFWKEIPFSSLNDTESAQLSKAISALPKRKEKLPTTIFEKLNVFYWKWGYEM